MGPMWMLIVGTAEVLQLVEEDLVIGTGDPHRHQGSPFLRPGNWTPGLPSIRWPTFERVPSGVMTSTSPCFMRVMTARMP